jgi:1-acyl-sn-glycerol-3-phosphate acyltransferase/nucleoside-diphosphate-sugar epimerase
MGNEWVRSFEMARILVIDERDRVADLLVGYLRESQSVDFCMRAPQQEDGFGGHLSGGYSALIKEQGIDTVVYSPPLCGNDIDLDDAELVCRQCAGAGIEKFVLLSSAMIYGASPHNQGLIAETQPILSDSSNRLARGWYKLEALAFSFFGEASNISAELTILRPATVLVPRTKEYFGRLFHLPIAITLPGHDPTMQLLSPEDLATAVRCVVEKGAAGVYNVAPRSTITLRAALRQAGVKRVPVSRVLQRAARRTLKASGLVRAIDHLDYIRYSWTISDRKIRRELLFESQHSSAEALAQFRRDAGCETHSSTSQQALQHDFDDFGMDKKYIGSFGRTLFRFLHDFYWRVEVKGLDQVPRQGRAVLVGIHRGFMPWDGVMALHLLVQKLKRYPRFLIHPGLIKFPFLFNYMTKLGGIIACQENGAYVLERDEMLGVFPEGIRGAFAMYRDAYKLGKFGRDEYVKMALRHRAPIVPFVTVGSAEIFPIIGKINWAWWKRQTEWPTFPITPTFPFLPPIPLPAKWHTQFLPPIHIEERYPPEAAGDPATVRAISLEVRTSMKEAVEEMLRRRKSIFYGSIFQEPRSHEETLSERLTFDEKPIYKERVS